MNVVVVSDVMQLDLHDSRQPIYDRPVRVGKLYEDPDSGAEHYVVVYPAGMRSTRHTHTAARTIIVLEGQLTANGRQLGSGGYVHFPAGTAMHHEPAGSGGCTFVSIFDGPLDVIPE